MATRTALSKAQGLQCSIGEVLPFITQYLQQQQEQQKPLCQTQKGRAILGDYSNLKSIQRLYGTIKAICCLTIL